MTVEKFFIHILELTDTKNQGEHTLYNIINKKSRKIVDIIADKRKISRVIQYATNLKQIKSCLRDPNWKHINREYKLEFIDLWNENDIINKIKNSKNEIWISNYIEILKSRYGNIIDDIFNSSQNIIYDILKYILEHYLNEYSHDFGICKYYEFNFDNFIKNKEIIFYGNIGIE